MSWCSRAWTTRSQMMSSQPRPEEVGGQADLTRVMSEPLDPFGLGPLGSRRVIRGTRHGRHHISISEEVEPGDVVELADGTQLVIMGGPDNIAGALELPRGPGKPGWWYEPQLAISPELRVEYEEPGGVDG